MYHRLAAQFAPIPVNWAWLGQWLQGSWGFSLQQLFLVTWSPWDVGHEKPRAINGFQNCPWGSRRRRLDWKSVKGWGAAVKVEMAQKQDREYHRWGKLGHTSNASLACVGDRVRVEDWNLNWDVQESGTYFTLRIREKSMRDTKHLSKEVILM